MVRDELSVMSAFLAVADERSFTKAAKRLGVTQSALSHAIRGLEEQVGVRLLARTTRSVAPTEAGEQLLDELRPALTGIRGALDKIGGLRDTPRGRVRLLVPRLAAMSVLGPKLATFARDYPDVVLDVSTDESRLDLVASGFDAGVQNKTSCLALPTSRLRDEDCYEERETALASAPLEPDAGRRYRHIESGYLGVILLILLP